MKLYEKANVLASGAITVANAPAITVGPEGVVTYIVEVDDGTGGVTTDSPDITWGLFCSDAPDAPYIRLEGVDSDLATALAQIEPAGDDAVVSATATISGMSPGMQLKLVPVSAAGGGGDSRLTVRVVSS